ncbi:MAG: phage tail protein [Bacilli bacterium]|nr:phage tail protein [Bacilli bacterium]
MIKIFNVDDTDFSSNGNIVINPLKCEETKKKSLNGWYIDVEIPIEYKEYIDKSKLFVVKTKSKLNPQAFFIDNDEEIQFTDKKITFRANHVAFKASNYLLIDVRPTDLNGAGALDYINTRLDRESPFTVNSDVENVNTAYFIRKTLLEALEIIEERWGGSFDIDNWNIKLEQNVGVDRGEIIAYGKNLENIKVFEDWSNVVTKLYPVGKDGLMLPEEYLETEEVEYDEPFLKTVTFETDIENEEDQTEEALEIELRYKAQDFISKNQFPMVSYEITSDINQLMEIGDTIHVKHPLVDLQTEVLEYQYNVLTKRVTKLIFGNYTRDVKKRFDSIKEEIKINAEKISSQGLMVEHQTNLIKSLNKNGLVYIDDNEVLILDKLPREEATNVWRLGLGGFGFSSNGYNGDYELAMTQDGRINADFITSGTLDGELIKAGTVTADKIASNVLTYGGTNLIKNSVGHYQGDWENKHEGFTNTEIKNNTVSGHCFFIGNKSSNQVIQVQNGTYTIGFKYKKLLELAEVNIKVNDHEIELSEMDWTSQNYTFEVLSNAITVELIGDNNNSCYLSDLMINQGIVAHVWSSASGESINGGVKIGSSIEIESSVSNIKQIMDNDGNRIKNISTDETVAEFTDKGMNSKEIKTEKAKIARVVIQDVGNSTWLTRI